MIVDEYCIVIAQVEIVTESEVGLDCVYLAKAEIQMVLEADWRWVF